MGKEGSNNTEALGKFVPCEITGDSGVVNEINGKEPGTTFILLGGGSNGVNEAAMIQSIVRRGLLTDKNGIPLPTFGLSAGVMVSTLLATDNLDKTAELFNYVNSKSKARNFPRVISEEALMEVKEKFFPDLLEKLQKYPNPLYACLTRADSLETVVVDLRNGKTFIKDGNGGYAEFGEKANVEQVLLASISSIIFTGDPGKKIFDRGELADVLFADGAFGDASYVPLKAVEGVLKAEGIELKRILVFNNYKLEKWSNLPETLVPLLRAASLLLTEKYKNEKIDRHVLVRMIKATFNEYNLLLDSLTSGKTNIKGNEGNDVSIASIYPPENVTSGVVLGATPEKTRNAFRRTNFAFQALWNRLTEYGQ